jgi:hypothetical protein
MLVQHGINRYESAHSEAVTACRDAVGCQATHGHAPVDSSTVTVLLSLSIA